MHPLAETCFYQTLTGLIIRKLFCISGKAERSTIFDLGQGCVLASRNGRSQWLKNSRARLGVQTTPAQRALRKSRIQRKGCKYECPHFRIRSPSNPTLTAPSFPQYPRGHKSHVPDGGPEKARIGVENEDLLFIYTSPPNPSVLAAVRWCHPSSHPGCSGLGVKI
jgi:hypothetical protein